MCAHSKGGGRQKKKREFISHFYHEMKVMCIAGELLRYISMFSHYYMWTKMLKSICTKVFSVLLKLTYS